MIQMLRCKLYYSVRSGIESSHRQISSTFRSLGDQNDSLTKIRLAVKSQVPKLCNLGEFLTFSNHSLTAY